eukprot:gene395-1791_t
MSIFAHPREKESFVVMTKKGWVHEDMAETVRSLVVSTAERTVFEADSVNSYSREECNRIQESVDKCYEDDDDDENMRLFLKRVEEHVRKNSQKVIRTIIRKGVELDL